MSFYQHADLLARLTLSALQRTPAHAGIEERFQSLLALGERLLFWCSGAALHCAPTPRLAHGDLPRRIERDLTALAAGRRSLGEVLVLEPWLKAILDGSGCPGRDSARRGWRPLDQFNLFDSLVAVDVVDEPSLERFDRDGETERGEDVASAAGRTYLARNRCAHSGAGGGDGRDTWIVALAALDLQRNALRSALSSLVARTVPCDGRSPGVRALIASCRETWSRAQATPPGAHARRVVERLTPSSNGSDGYLLLLGPPWARCEALVPLLLDHRSSGSGAEEVRWELPWGPSLLYHCTRTHSDPATVARSLVAQANSCLAKPVTTDSQRAEWTPAYARSVLYEALSRLVDERGEALVVLDGLERLVGSSVGLEVLPPTLPTRARMIMLADSASASFATVRQYLRARVIDIEELRRDLLGTFGPDESVDVIEPAPSAVEERAAIWREHGVAEILALLGSLAPEQSVTCGIVAQFLARGGQWARADEIRRRLAPLACDLAADEWRADRLRLTSRALAQHACDLVGEECLPNWLQEQGRWLAAEAADATLLAPFLAHWGGLGERATVGLRDPAALLDGIPPQRLALILEATFEAFQAVHEGLLRDLLTARRVMPDRPDNAYELGLMLVHSSPPQSPDATRGRELIDEAAARENLPARIWVAESRARQTGAYGSLEDLAEQCWEGALALARACAHRATTADEPLSISRAWSALEAARESGAPDDEVERTQAELHERADALARRRLCFECGRPADGEESLIERPMPLAFCTAACRLAYAARMNVA